MSAYMRLFNFHTKTAEDVEIARLEPEHGVFYIPTDIGDVVEEAYWDYIHLGFTVGVAIEMTYYETMLAFRDVYIELYGGS